MTLQHRRSTSNVGFTPIHAQPMLSRKHRSSSVLTPIDKGRDREETIRQRLASSAEETLELPSTSQQDKARSAWVKRWCVVNSAALT
jgi:hypothetical protein